MAGASRAPRVLTRLLPRLGALHYISIQRGITWDVSRQQRNRHHAKDRQPSVLVVAGLRNPSTSHTSNPTRPSTTTAGVQAHSPDGIADEPPTADVTTARLSDIHQEVQPHAQLICTTSTCDIHWPALWLLMAGRGDWGEGVGGGC